MESWVGQYATNSPCFKERATRRGVPGDVPAQESVPPLCRALMRHRRYDVGATWDGWGSTRPSCQGVKRSVWDPETFAPGGGMSNWASRLEGASR